LSGAVVLSRARLPTGRARAVAGNPVSGRARFPDTWGRVADRGGAAVHAAKWDFAAIAIYPKLEVGAADDPLEHEADRVADQVMRMPDPAPSSSSAPPRISRKCAACEEDGKVRPKRAIAPGFAGAAPAGVRQAIAGPGRPLDAATRHFFEPRFGHDFSRVRIHAGAQAAASARALAAQAYTVGADIVFAGGKFSPATTEGRRLVAHELSHVVQQQVAQPSGAGVFPRLARSPTVVAHQPQKPPPAKADPNVELSNRLQKLLRDGKRDAVTKEVEALSAASRDPLEAATGHSAQADELVRIIRFVRHKPPAAPPEPSVTADLGTAVPKSGAKVLGGTVEMHTGGTINPEISAFTASAQSAGCFRPMLQTRCAIYCCRNAPKGRSWQPTPRNRGNVGWNALANESVSSCSGKAAFSEKARLCLLRLSQSQSPPRPNARRLWRNGLAELGSRRGSGRVRPGMKSPARKKKELASRARPPRKQQRPPGISAKYRFFPAAPRSCFECRLFLRRRNSPVPFRRNSASAPLMIRWSMRRTALPTR
jgi:hypothetical protein